MEEVEATHFGGKREREREREGAIFFDLERMEMD